jgi:Flp pilus assembly protein CpaB
MAFLLAAGATVAVFLYLNNVRKEAEEGEFRVVVSTQDIPASSDLDSYIQDGAFTTITVPEDAFVQGAVTRIEDLANKTNVSALYAQEQIPLQRVTGSEPGGSYGISEGYQAVTIRLSAQQVVGAPLVRGSHVTVYSLFDGATAEDVRKGGGGPISTTERGPAVSGVVLPVVPDVRVLDVLRPGLAAGTQASDEDALITMELLPVDAEKVLFAQQQGTVWLALLPPDEEGVAVPPVDFTELAVKKK